MILIKKKQLGTLPSTIAPPTAEELLRNISWLENEKKQIEFIQVIFNFFSWFWFIYYILFSKEKYYRGVSLDFTMKAQLSSSLERIKLLLCMKNSSYPDQILKYLFFEYWINFFENLQVNLLIGLKINFKMFF